MPRLTGTAGASVRTAREAFNLQPPAGTAGTGSGQAILARHDEQQLSAMQHRIAAQQRLSRNDLSSRADHGPAQQAELHHRQIPSTPDAQNGLICAPGVDCPSARGRAISAAKQGLDELTALVKTRLGRMRYRPGLIDGFLAKTGLDLTT